MRLRAGHIGRRGLRVLRASVWRAGVVCIGGRAMRVGEVSRLVVLGSGGRSVGSNGRGRGIVAWVVCLQ